MSRFMIFMRRLIDILLIFYFRLFLRRLIDVLFFYFEIFLRRYGRLIFFIYDIFKTSFFIRHLFVDIGRIQQNVYFTIVGINFFAEIILSQQTCFNSCKINGLLNTAILCHYCY